jgi:hypothetical protein
MASARRRSPKYRGRYGNAAGEAAFAIDQERDRGGGFARGVYELLVKGKGEVLDQITGDSEDPGRRLSDAGQDNFAVRLEGQGSSRVIVAKEVGDHFSVHAETGIEHAGLFVAGKGEVLGSNGGCGVAGAGKA